MPSPYFLPPYPQFIPPEEAEDFLEEHEDEIFLMDVRSPLEFIQEHLEGARNIPIDELPDRLKELPNEKLIITYCMKGGRCTRAAEWLSQKGYKVASIRGGMSALKAARTEPKLP